MQTSTFLPINHLVICFAHVAYQFSKAFSRRNCGIQYFEVRTFEDLKTRINDADILVVSGLWNNSLLNNNSRLKLVQSISAGIEQYDKHLFENSGEKI